MSTPALPINWCSFDDQALPIDVSVDPTPPAAAALLASVNTVVMAVAVTPYAATGHLCFRHGYVGGVATTACDLYFTMSIAPGAVHAKFASNDRMVDGAMVSPPSHSVWTQTGGTVGANVAILPMYAPPGLVTGNTPSFWVGTQYPVESGNTIDDTPVASSNRMLELPSYRHPVKENGYCTSVMAWSCRVVHLTSDLASL